MERECGARESIELERALSFKCDYDDCIELGVLRNVIIALESRRSSSRLWRVMIRLAIPLSFDVHKSQRTNQ